jgi:hypothetical protein
MTINRNLSKLTPKVNENGTLDGSIITSGTISAARLPTNSSQILYSTTIADSLGTPEKVGGIPANTLASALKTKTIVQLFDDLLFPTVLPTYTLPTISLTADKSGYQEIGSTIAQGLSQTCIENDAGAFTQLVFKRGGVLIHTVPSPTTGTTTALPTQFGYVNPNNPNTSYSGSHTNSFLVTSGVTSWTAEGTYNAGLAKLTNKGTTDTTTPAVGSTAAPQATSTLVSASRSITGIYPYFYGVSNSAPTASNIATAINSGVSGVTVNKVLSDASGAIAITFNASAQYVWFAIEENYANKTDWYNTGINNGKIGGVLGGTGVNEPQFILAPVTVSVVSQNGFWTRNFKIYISKASTDTLGSFTFS